MSHYFITFSVLCLIVAALCAGLFAGYMIGNLRTELRDQRRRIEALEQSTGLTSKELQEELDLRKRHDQEK